MDTVIKDNSVEIENVEGVVDDSIKIVEPPLPPFFDMEIIKRYPSDSEAMEAVKWQRKQALYTKDCFLVAFKNPAHKGYYFKDRDNYTSFVSDYMNEYNHTPLAMIEQLEFVMRSVTDIDPTYTQLCVAAIVTDGIRFAVLKTFDKGDIKNKLTLVQGHVEFNEKVYTSNLFSFIKEETKRELNEELTISASNLKSLTYKGTIELTDTVVDVMHLGLLHVLRVKDISLVESNEPDKHTVLYYTAEELLENYEEADTWLQYFIRTYIGKPKK